MNVRIWNTEEEAELVKQYVENELSINEIADYFGKNNRSIITKLVQLKVYKKPQKNGENKRTVKTMLIELEELLNIELEGASLTKKSNLEKLVDALKLRLDQETK